jgi:hypothetical protein
METSEDDETDAAKVGCGMTGVRVWATALGVWGVELDCDASREVCRAAHMLE